ncbi:Cyclic nucleotide-gated ion channel 1 [Vitis vinifera]|uniref:Cyclic nucleotide-gated ion channel 1 n=1 Tax=Vitis vinifera TaxID=29760 RepID=A0A438JLR8_VITVI|nr:Cyclic nucleotide-gated ion channel 1 [Vitis vinifera]
MCLKSPTFRLWSQKWRTWAACFIQVAWWRYQKRKQNKALQEAEDRLRDALSKAVGTSTTLGATNYASRFAANMLRILRRNGGSRARLPQRSWFALPPKPRDPQLTI